MQTLNLNILNETTTDDVDNLLLQDKPNPNQFYYIKDDILYKLQKVEEQTHINFFEENIKIVEAMY